MNACRLALAVGLAGMASIAAAGECLPQVEQGWVRPPPVAMPMMAGFASIRNPCPAAIAVVSVSSPSFAEVSIHETREIDGVNRMREVERLEVAAGQSVELKPGGLHLMLFRPYSTLKEGDKLAIIVKLADGREIPAEFEVRKPKP